MAGATDRRWLVGCVLLAVVLRMPFLSWTLGLDEGGTAYVARQWRSPGTSLYGSMWLDRPPLLLALYRLAVVDGAQGVRVLGVAAAIAIVTAAFAIGREIAGPTAARTAGVLAALLTGSAALDAVMTPGELLAAGPSALSVLCLLRGRRDREGRWLALAGALAVSAALIKQSFLDAGTAGMVYALLRCREHRTLRPFGAFAGGAALPLVSALVWTQAMDVNLDQLVYALVGFRTDSLRVLATSSQSLPTRMWALVPPVAGSGLVIVLALAGTALLTTRIPRQLRVLLAAWLGTAFLGVAAGGSYWHHYLIQLVVPAVVPACILLAAPPRRLTRAAVSAAAIVGVVMAGLPPDVVMARRGPEYGTELTTAAYLRQHARPGDTAYVLYARANVLFYDGLRTPFPYDWSLMVRAVPGARTQLRRLIASRRRPTWIVQWHPTTQWGLDRDGRLAALLRREYRPVGPFTAHPVLLRRDVRRPAGT